MGFIRPLAYPGVGDFRDYFGRFSIYLVGLCKESCAKISQKVPFSAMFTQMVRIDQSGFA
jgi:hypothetical protein